MPYIITTVNYPADKVNAVVERYFEALGKFPPDESLGTVVVQDAVKATSSGIKSINIMEPNPGKLEAAMRRISSKMAMFYSIPGFAYEMNIFYRVEEALENIGQRLPGQD